MYMEEFNINKISLKFVVIQAHFFITMYNYKTYLRQVQVFERNIYVACWLGLKQRNAFNV